MSLSDAHQAAAQSQVVEHRRYARFPVSLPVVFGDGVLEATGTVVDLSREGCRIRCDGAVPQGKYFLMEMHLGEFAETLRVDLAVMRWSDAGECGVEFIRMEPAQQARLQRTIRLCEEARAGLDCQDGGQNRIVAALSGGRTEHRS